MTRKARKPNTLARELKEMGDALHRLGALSDAEHTKITMRHTALDKIERADPLSPGEIVAIREAAHMSQSVFARLLDVSTGTLSKWERGELKPRGPANRLLHVIRTRGVAAILSA